MSAFVCNDYHVSLLAAYAVSKRLSCVNGLDAEQVGKILYAENLASATIAIMTRRTLRTCLNSISGLIQPILARLLS